MGSCSHSNYQEDSSSLEIFCLDCYEVLPFRAKSTLSYETVGLSPISNFSIGLTTAIKSEGLDYTGRKVNKKLLTNLVDSSRKAKTSPALSKNKFRGSLELKRIANILEVPKRVEELAKAKFIEYCDKKYLKGRNLYSCIYCILLISAAEEDHPLNINQILKATSIARKRINMDYHMVYRLYEMAPKTIAGTEAHCQKLISFVSGTNWLRMNDFTQMMKNLAVKLNDQGIMGRRAIIILAAASTNYLKNNAYPNVSQFIKMTGLNKNTILGKIDRLKEEDSQYLQ